MYDLQYFTEQTVGTSQRMELDNPEVFSISMFPNVLL